MMRKLLFLIIAVVCFTFCYFNVSAQPLPPDPTAGVPLNKETNFLLIASVGYGLYVLMKKRNMLKKTSATK